MNIKDSLQKWIKDKFPGQPPSSPEKKQGKPYYLLVLLLVGIAFMVIGAFWNGNDNESTTAFNINSNEDDEALETFGKEIEENSMKYYEQQYENQLKEALDQVVGVSDVVVVVNVQSSEEMVYEKNTIIRNQTTSEQDTEGGVREIEDQSTEDQLVIVNDGSKDIPVVRETRKPGIKGVLVVAGGAENIQVEKWIVEAVTRVLDVPSHRVSVVPKKSKGDS